MRDYACQALGREFYLDPDAKVLEMGLVDGKAQIRYVNLDGEEVCERFDYVLAATGRAPNVRGLALENAGLELDAGGVPKFDPRTLQCGDSPIFIAGDASNILPLLHEAADEGKTAGDNAALYPAVQAGLRRSSIAVVFSDPQMMMVGSRFADLPADGFVVGEVSFEDQGRSRVMGVNQGLLHVYAERGSGRFLGAEMIGTARREPGPSAGLEPSARADDRPDAGDAVLPPGDRRLAHRAARCRRRAGARVKPWIRNARHCECSMFANPLLAAATAGFSYGTTVLVSHCPRFWRVEGV